MQPDSIWVERAIIFLLLSRRRHTLFFLPSPFEAAGCLGLPLHFFLVPSSSSSAAPIFHPCQHLPPFPLTRKGERRSPLFTSA